MKFVGDPPKFRDELATSLASHPRTAGLAQSLRRLQPGRLVEGVDLRAALAVGASLAEVIGYGITAIFLTIYLLSDRERCRSAVRARPRRFHVRTARVVISLEAIVGGYIRARSSPRSSSPCSPSSC